MPENYQPPHSTRRVFIIALVVVIVLAGWGIFTRIEASSDLKDRTEELAVPVVNVIKAPSGPASEEIILPGTSQAWHEAPLYARTNGYIKEWKTDIGAHVKEGDVLAVIEAPEVDAQLRQAQADLATAEANSSLARSTAARWQSLLKTNSVSKQETDEKVSDAAAKAAGTASSKANLERLHQLESFKRVTAPFEGIVTARNIDTGSLINAGSGSAGNGSTGPELFHIADVSKLRVYVQVPETYTPAVNDNLTAEFVFSGHPGKRFAGKMVDTSHALDPATHTLLVQFEVDNTEGALMPGGYTEAHLKLPTGKDSVRLPINTLLFRSDGLQVAVVGNDNAATLTKITVGRDFGKEVEVLAGLNAGDQVIVNPPDSLGNGEKVKIAPEKPKKDEGAPAASESKDEKKDEKK